MQLQLLTGLQFSKLISNMIIKIIKFRFCKLLIWSNNSMFHHNVYNLIQDEIISLGTLVSMQPFQVLILLKEFTKCDERRFINFIRQFHLNFFQLLSYQVFNMQFALFLSLKHELFGEFVDVNSEHKLHIPWVYFGARVCQVILVVFL